MHEFLHMVATGNPFRHLMRWPRSTPATSFGLGIVASPPTAHKSPVMHIFVVTGGSMRGGPYDYRCGHSAQGVFPFNTVASMSTNPEEMR